MRACFLVVTMFLAGCSGPPATDASVDDAATDVDSAQIDTAGLARLVTVRPGPRGVGASPDAAIELEFQRPLGSDEVPQVWAFGRYSGVRRGVTTLSADSRTVALAIEPAWTAGDRITVFASGGALRSEGFSFHYWTRAAPADLSFVEQQRFVTRTGAPTQSYGASAADLDGDGDSDLMVVNELTSDVRIYRNLGDGTFETTPSGTIALEAGASPSEVSDFDGDGVEDLAVTNVFGGSVAVALGDGTGMFLEPLSFGVGAEPRGMVVLDVEGDGDADIVVTSSVRGDLALLENDGSGRFAVSSFGARVASWGIGTGDFDEDGILDIVAGGREGGMVVYRGTGAGGVLAFEELARPAPESATWTIAIGDLNGDGHEDIVSADGHDDATSVLFGDGTGAFTFAEARRDVPRSTSVDIADLDGDDDLDVVWSSIFTPGWLVAENDAGTLTLFETVPASRTGSCAVLFDVDGDRDVDMILIDETSDEVIVRHN